MEAFELPVAQSQIVEFAGRRTLVVERFDRLWTRDRRLLRVPQEDCCQALSVPPSLKYEPSGGPGMVAIARLLKGSDTPDLDLRRFFKTQVLFWLIAATDGHAKNFSIVLNAGGSYRLTPRYDVLSAHNVLGRKAGTVSPHKVNMAMGVRGSKALHYNWNDILPRHFESTARRCGLGDEVGRMIDGLIARTEPAIESVQRLLPADFPQELAHDLFAGLRGAAHRMKAR